MGGKKAGGGKGKKKEQEEKDVLTEVDREYYELQLVDLNRKLSSEHNKRKRPDAVKSLQKLRNRVVELENVNTTLDEELRTLDEDRADIIAYLKKTLQTKTDEMTELQERLDGLKQSMESSVLLYKGKITQMEQDFKNMHEELTSEIKLLMGKLNSLEEFRTQRDELMAKFANQEERMREMEENRQKTLYECEKNFVVEKDKLKKQMETRLLELSLQFQQATDVRIASTTHRMIRENIAVNNELDLLQEVQKQMLVAFDDLKEAAHTAQIEVKLREEERDQALQKNLRLLKTLNRLKSENTELQNQMGEFENARKMKNEMLSENSAIKEALESANSEIISLNRRYADGQANAAKLYADVAALKVSGRRLYGILHKAVVAVKEALQIKEQNESDEALVSCKRDDLLNNLLELLNRATTSEKERYTCSESSSLQGYSSGDLGFIPRDDEE